MKEIYGFEISNAKNRFLIAITMKFEFHMEIEKE